MSVIGDDEFPYGKSIGDMPFIRGVQKRPPLMLPPRELPESFIKAQYAVGELESMVGMNDVAEQFTKIISSFVASRSLLRRRFANSALAHTLHMVFDGNPGTGKTTVARLVGDILHGANILKKGHLVEVKASDLIGKYVGHTAPKVSEACEDAKGGVLFIDEAYTLVEQGQNFGAEAITELLQHMENDRDEFMVVFAGYPKQMESLMGSNPGLSSRVPHKITFRDYTKYELTQILDTMAKQRSVGIERAASGKVVEHLWQERAKSPESFGNARDVRNVLQKLTDIAIRKEMDAAGMGSLKSVLAMAARVEKTPQIRDIFVTQAHVAEYLQGLELSHEIPKTYGFDLGFRK